MMLHSNNTPLNILSSFAYLYKQKEFLNLFCELHKTGEANCMIDSGAFTKHNATKNTSYVTLDNYCDFIEEYGQYCEKYVMLDKVFDNKQSKLNYEEMVRRGLKPMFVLTMDDNDWDYFKQTLSVNPNCCVAGGATTRSNWLKQRFQYAYKNTQGKAKIHGLAYVEYPEMYQLPLVSADSASWQGGCLYGTIHRFTSKGKQSCWRMDYLRNKKKIPNELKDLLEQLEVTPREFVKEENWKGEKSLAALLNTVAYLSYQKYSFKQGLRLFLAVGSVQQLKKLYYVYKNYKTLTFKSFKQDA